MKSNFGHGLGYKINGKRYRYVKMEKGKYLFTTVSSERVYFTKEQLAQSNITLLPKGDGNA